MALGTSFRAVTGRLSTMCPYVKTKNYTFQELFVFKKKKKKGLSVSKIQCLPFSMVIRNSRDVFVDHLRNSKIYNDQYVSISQPGLAPDVTLYFSVKLDFYQLLIFPILTYGLLQISQSPL